MPILDPQGNVETAAQAGSCVACLLLAGRGWRVPCQTSNHILSNNMCVHAIDGRMRGKPMPCLKKDLQQVHESLTG